MYILHDVTNRIYILISLLDYIIHELSVFVHFEVLVSWIISHKKLFLFVA